MEPEAPEPSMQLLAEAAQNETHVLVNGNAIPSDHDDRSSSLSDLDEQPATEGTDNNDRSSQESDDDDTEAETERLEESPQKTRNQKQVLLTTKISDGGLEASEETLIAIERADGAGNSDIARDFENQHEIDGAPQTSDISSLEDSGEGSEPETTSSMSSKKRKRSNDEDDTKTSLKKVALELANHVADKADAEHSHELPAQREEPEVTSGALREPPVSDDEAEHSSPEDQASHEPENGTTTEAPDAPESNDDDVDMEDAGQEADAASAARSEEEMARKKAAMDMLSKIEANFAVLRDKLFAEKNAQLTEELATMQSENITHPEYLAMVDAIEQLRKDRLRHAQTLYNYKVQALRNRSTANRAQVLSQYVQTARDLRETALDDIGKEWYRIQRGRRNIEEDKTTKLNHFTGTRVEQVARHTAYNAEVSVLSGFAKYVGFPAAPLIEGATQMEIENDLRTLGITRQAVNIPDIPVPSALNFGRQRPAAEEQFIENTPWANPNHPYHAINKQQPTQMRPPSPFTTPIAQKNSSEALLGSASTIAALPSSSLAPTPLSTEASTGKAVGLYSKVVKDIATETPSRPPPVLGGTQTLTNDKDQTTKRQYSEIVTTQDHEQITPGSSQMNTNNLNDDPRSTRIKETHQPTSTPIQESPQKAQHHPDTNIIRQPHVQVRVEVTKS